MHVLLQSLFCWVQNRIILNCITTAPDCMLKVTGKAMSNDPANMTMHIPCQPLDWKCCFPSTLEASHRYFCLGLDGIFLKCLEKTKQYICRRAAFIEARWGVTKRIKITENKVLFPCSFHHTFIIHMSSISPWNVRVVTHESAECIRYEK